METAITFTFGQVVTACGAIVTVSAVVALVAKVITKILEPNKTQDDRLATIEKANEDLEHRVEAIEDSGRITQRALLALLKHGIDGNAIDSMKEAEDELTKYLIKK